MARYVPGTYFSYHWNFTPFDHRPPPLTSGNCKSDLYELEPFRILLNYIYFFSHEFPVCFLLEYSFFFLFDLSGFFVYWEFCPFMFYISCDYS